MDSPVVSSDPGKVKLTFGKHNGLMLEQVPISYLRWMAGSIDHKPGLIASVKAVLADKCADWEDGETAISLHAIERFSQRAERVFINRTDKSQGIISLLREMAEEARARSPEGEGDIETRYADICWCFSRVNDIWTLKTVKSSSPRGEQDE